VNSLEMERFGRECSEEDNEMDVRMLVDGLGGGSSRIVYFVLVLKAVVLSKFDIWLSTCPMCS
jgi:hypothetical protein